MEEIKPKQTTVNSIVYTWGLGKEGQIGNGNDENQPIPVKLKLKNVIEVKAGGQFSACVTKEGNLYMFGSNKKGQLGTVPYNQNQLVPKQVDNLKNIVSVALGDWHSLALDSNGICYGVGYNKNGNLGLPSQQVEKFTKIPLDTVIQKIYAGSQISLFISQNNNQIYSCGCKDLNGNKSQEDQKTPQLIENLQEKQIISASAGFSSCGAIDSQGNLYTWGKGINFNLGHGNENYIKQPKLVKYFQQENIQLKQISCTRGYKYLHMGVIDTQGRAYTWGSGYKAKLGHGNQGQQDQKKEGGYNDEKLPKLIKSLENDKVKKFISGGIHSTVLLENGDLRTFGCGSDGRLGHPDIGTHRYLYKETVPKTVIFDQKQNQQQQVIYAFSSYYHMIALVYQGSQ